MAISWASSETKGKKVYSATLTLSPTCMGKTQPHGDPGGVFVYGSVHTVAEQSADSMSTCITFKIRWAYALHLGR